MHKFIVNDRSRLANNSWNICGSNITVKQDAWGCLSASASAFYPLQHPQVSRSARPHFTPPPRPVGFPTSRHCLYIHHQRTGSPSVRVRFRLPNIRWIQRFCGFASASGRVLSPHILSGVLFKLQQAVPALWNHLSSVGRQFALDLTKINTNRLLCSDLGIKLINNLLCNFKNSRRKTSEARYLTWPQTEVIKWNAEKLSIVQNKKNK